MLWTVLVIGELRNDGGLTHTTISTNDGTQ